MNANLNNSNLNTNVNNQTTQNDNNEMSALLQRVQACNGDLNKLLAVVPTCIDVADDRIYGLEISLCRGGLQIVQYTDGDETLAYAERPELDEAIVKAVELLHQAWQPSWEVF